MSAAYKQAIITYTNKFLPMQLMYGGTTERSIPRYNFSKSFLLSANLKHFSSTDESLKLMDEIIPHIQLPQVIQLPQLPQLIQVKYSITSINSSTSYSIRAYKVAIPKWSPYIVGYPCVFKPNNTYCPS